MNTKAIDYIKSVTNFKPDVLLTLGSGLGSLAEEVKAHAIINYSDIPDFPTSTAPGHKGRFIFTVLGNKNVAIMQGRIHMYEGYTAQQAVMPLRLMHALGANTLFLTNASGGINKDFSIGDFMVITDHISLFVPSPLKGSNDDSLGTRFPDMSNVYSKSLQQLIKSTAGELKIPVKQGVYIQLPGPAFETPAEIKMCSALGADAVGMSTAVEAQAARHCGMEVCAVSCITNLACGLLDTPLSGDDVNNTAKRVAPMFKSLITETIKRM